LPLGIPGMGDDIEGAMQQAPQPVRHSIIRLHRQEQNGRSVTNCSKPRLASSSAPSYCAAIKPNSCT
jgi:hypothetical protein